MWASQAAGGQKSECLVAAQSDISALSPPTGPNMTVYWVQLPLEGPLQSRLCLGDWPRLSQHLASRLWADAQKMQLMPTSEIPRWDTASWPWLLRAERLRWRRRQRIERLKWLLDTSIFRNKHAITGTHSGWWKAALGAHSNASHDEVTEHKSAFHIQDVTQALSEAAEEFNKDNPRRTLHLLHILTQHYEQQQTRSS